MQNALALLRSGKPAEALAAARSEYDPTSPDHRLWLGLIHAANGQASEAAALLGAALKPGEGNPQHWRVLASVRAQVGDRTGEVAAFREAVALDPSNAQLRRFLAAALRDAGDADQALKETMAALRLEEVVEARRLFSELIGDVRHPPSEARPLLTRALREAWGPFYRLSRGAMHFIGSTTDLEDDELTIAALEAGPVHDPALERRLTVIRREHLLGRALPEPFASALARQCWINEFCWNVTEEEEVALAGLPEHDPRRALYVEVTTPQPRQAPVLTPIRGSVSAEVRAMYEQNPYPRWVMLPEQEPRPVDWVVRSMFPFARIEPIPGSEILVAGCGAGQHALQIARRYQGAQVLAIDLSQASLGYAIGKAAELGVTNLTFGQADILEMPALGKQFDLISCAGTLQAMEDPLEGCRALAGMLKPGALLHLGLYSRLARAELAPAQAFASGFSPTRDGIRKLRAAILNAPAGDPIRAAAEWNDFYSTSNVRDLLMHVMEHQSTVDDVQAMTEGMGLRFLGFDAPSAVLAAYRRRYPDDLGGVDFENWRAFEERNPSIFRGMYQAWAQKPVQ